MPTQVVFFSVFAFMFGLAVGSFLNVCIYRIPRGMSVAKPRSACPLCGAGLKAHELIPLISYAALRGKCSACSGRINIRYLIVETLCGALWVILLHRFHFSFEYICYAVLCSILLAVFFIDMEWMRIPNVLTIAACAPAIAVGAKYALFSADPERFRSAYQSINPAEPLLGLLPALFFFAVFAISSAVGGGKSAVGMGDVKILLPAGFALGLRQGAFAAFTAVALGGLAGVILLAAGIKKIKDPIPFGPFIVIGVYAALLFPISNIFI